MDLGSIPLELREVAKAAADSFDGFKFSVDKAIAPNAPFRTTMLGKRFHEFVLIEAQITPRYDEELIDLARWLSNNRSYASFYIVCHGDQDIPGGLIQRIRRDGVGFLNVDDEGEVYAVQQPKNFALLVTHPPTSMSLSTRRQLVIKLYDRFNLGDRKDALRDLFELIELETDKLAEKAVRKGYITLAQASVDAMDWSNKIDILGSQNRYAAGRNLLISSKEKADLHSFRGARNLFDHPAKTARAEQERNLQCQERMIQGPRLLSVLLRANRSIR